MGIQKPILMAIALWALLFVPSGVKADQFIGADPDPLGKGTAKLTYETAFYDTITVKVLDENYNEMETTIDFYKFVFTIANTSDPGEVGGLYGFYLDFIQGQEQQFHYLYDVTSPPNWSSDPPIPIEQPFIGISSIGWFSDGPLYDFFPGQDYSSRVFSFILSGNNIPIREPFDAYFASVPEPGTLLFLGAGLIGLGFLKRREIL